MRYLLFGLCFFLTLPTIAIDDLPIVFLRGDANGDDTVSGPDGSYITNYLFQGGPPPACFDAADANDDGEITTADASFIYQWLFNGGPQPPSPGPFNCGADPTEDYLECEDHPCNE